MWQKCSNNENSPYEDICNANLNRNVNRPVDVYNALKSDGCMMPKPKTDHGSWLCREVGNKLFNENKYYEAIELYNRAMCAAKSATSELVGLAYANRSACFFELQMYDKCLVDINLAKEANYPQRLMSKIDERQAECLRRIKTDAQPVPFEPKLSFESDENFPFMVNVLEIKRNDEFGRHVTVKCDIGVGETVLMEKAFMTAHRYEKFRRCDGCMKKDVNLIPCKKCTNTMFCSNECETNDFHKVECGVQTLPEENNNDNQLHIIRSILQAINIFSTVEELQTFVENAISSDPMEKPESILDEKARYRAFLKLWHEPNVFTRNMFGQQVYFVYRTLLDNSIIGPKFKTKQQKHFLMHLVAQHFCIINYSGNIMFDNSDDLVGWYFIEFRSVVSMYINHSCAPNVTLVSFNGYNVCVTIRPIKKGEQLFLSYFRNDKIQHSTSDRRKYILARCRFRCKCERCKGDSPSKGERDAMQWDECFRYIQKNKPKIKYELDGLLQTSAAKMLEDKCVEFLNRHGHKIWCQEIDLVADCYRRLLASKFNNTIYF